MRKRLIGVLFAVMAALLIVGPVSAKGEGFGEWHENPSPRPGAPWSGQKGK